MIKIIILGAKGKMGSRIIDIASQDNNISIVGGIEGFGHPSIGEKISLNNQNFIISDNLNTIIKNCDVVIDFTIPKVTLGNLDLLIKEKKSLVLGTTGFTEPEKQRIKDASSHISCVFSPNMSVGVNIFFKILDSVSYSLKDYDTEIIELHHNQKKDSPSGTALKAAEIIASKTDRSSKDFVYGREGNIGIRKKSEIGIHALRAGDIVGEHTVIFTGNSERLEINHKAHNRDNFAKGAILAAKWLKDKPNGLYNMWNVLDLK